jgi:hypothetical protein
MNYVRVQSEVQPSYELAVVVNRIHDGAPWATLKETFCLVPAAEWILWGPESAEGVHASFGGNRIRWDKALDAMPERVYRATTMLHNPIERHSSDHRLRQYRVRQVK